MRLFSNIKKSSNNDSEILLIIQLILDSVRNQKIINITITKQIINLIDDNIALFKKSSAQEKLNNAIKIKLNKILDKDASLNHCHNLLPKFIYYNNYFLVYPSIHLEDLAQRQKLNLIDDKNVTIWYTLKKRENCHRK